MGEANEQTSHVTFVDKVLEKSLLRFIPYWVVPNYVTFFRLLMIPVVVVCLSAKLYLAAAILFGIAAFSDAVDGALARTRNQITDMGKLLDPFVDKVLIGVVVIMVVPKLLGWVIVLIIIVLEALLVGNAYLLQRKRVNRIQANGAGKLKMIAQSFGVGTLLVYIIWPYPFLLLLSYALLYMAIACAAISLFVYRSI